MFAGAFIRSVCQHLFRQRKGQAAQKTTVVKFYLCSCLYLDWELNGPRTGISVMRDDR